MKKALWMMAVAAVLAVSGLWAQPKPKSQKEMDALMAIQNAQGPDAQIAAVENLLTKFADTEFKVTALQMATQSAQQKGDLGLMTGYAERTLKADPKNYIVMLMLAQATVQQTREFDLDKDEKLKNSEKMVNEALEILKAAPKFRPDLTDEQWAGAKKDFEAQGLETLGMTAMVRKNYPEAVNQFKKAVEVQGSPDPATKVHLARAYNAVANYDAATLTLDAVLATPDLHPSIRTVAGQEKLKAAQAKAAKK